MSVLLISESKRSLVEFMNAVYRADGIERSLVEFMSAVHRADGIERDRLLA